MAEAHLQQKPKQSLLDLRNTDLVSRLLAATPPYLYNIPLTPNSYFFSEMLKSLVHTKAENARQSLAHQNRRARKRSWTQAREYSGQQVQKQDKYDLNYNDWKSSFEAKRNEKPLELTKAARLPETSEEKIPMEKTEMHQIPQLFPPVQHSDSLMLPPPPPLPPLWYPPLYPPPYGIDPLHFFIDLRVSGHIYDRKKANETESTGSSETTEDARAVLPRETLKTNKHSSAFSVPNPKHSTPMNLSCTSVSETKQSTRFDVKSMGFEKDDNKTGTHYVMKNVNRIYRSVSECKAEPGDEETEEEKEKRVKNLRALIGLELMVDYMQHKTKHGNTSESSLTDVESVDSPSVDVVMCHDDDTPSQDI